MIDPSMRRYSGRRRIDFGQTNIKEIAETDMIAITHLDMKENQELTDGNSALTIDADFPNQDETEIINNIMIKGRLRIIGKTIADFNPMKTHRTNRGDLNKLCNSNTIPGFERNRIKNNSSHNNHKSNEVIQVNWQIEYAITVEKGSLS